MDEAKRLEVWARYLGDIRRFFDARGFIEVTTSTLVPAGAFEASLDCLEVKGEAGRWELPTSPEIEMKRLLAASRRSLYQIARAYRDDPPSPVHGREFLMLEYYRVGADGEGAIADTVGLVESLSPVPVRFSRATVGELFEEHAGFRLDPSLSRDDLAALATGSGVPCRDTDSWEDVFFKVMLSRIEPRFAPDTPVIVTGYPAQVSPLSLVDPVTGLADRFEIYWRGMEICNGCGELGDLEELRRRHDVESRARLLAGKRPHPAPERLYSALERGLPRCAGVAIGLERLFRCVGPEDYFPSSGSLF